MLLDGSGSATNRPNFITTRVAETSGRRRQKAMGKSYERTCNHIFRARRGHKNHAAIASSRRLVTGGPKKPMTMNTAIIALAINPNTPIVP